MTARPIPCFEIACAADDCSVVTGTYGEFSGWGEIGFAEEVWVDEDGQVAGERHYCSKHRLPACVDCGTVNDVEEDEPDGDLYCPTCMPASAARS